MGPDEEARRFWFGGYVQTSLERDLRQLSAVSSLPDFQRVMAVVTKYKQGCNGPRHQTTASQPLSSAEDVCESDEVSPGYASRAIATISGRSIRSWGNFAKAKWAGGCPSP